MLNSKTISYTWFHSCRLKRNNRDVRNLDTQLLSRGWSLYSVVALFSVWRRQDVSPRSCHEFRMLDECWVWRGRALSPLISVLKFLFEGASEVCFPGLNLKFVTVFWRVREDTNQSRTLTGFTQLQEPQVSAEPPTVWRSGEAWPQSAKLLAAPCGTECEREVSTQSLVLGHIGTLGHSGARVMSHYRRTKRNKQTQSWKNNSNYITWAGFTNTFLFTGVWNKLTSTWELNIF